MDEISEQLRTEIFTLEEYIERAEDRTLAARWTGQLLEPLERIGDELEPEELALVLETLRQARSKFEVNGHLGERLDGILEKHAPLLSDADTPELEGEAVEGVVLSVDAEAVEEVGKESADALFDAEDEESDESADTLFDADLDDSGADDESEVVLDEDGPAAADDLFDADDTSEGEVAADDLAEEADSVEPDVDAALPPPTTRPIGAEDDALEAPTDGDTNTLFEEDTPRPAAKDGAGKKPKQQRQIGEVAESKVRDASSRAIDAESDSPGYDIFSDKVSLEDLQAALSVSIPAEDLSHLENSLRARIIDKVVSTLRTNKAAEKQFILMPRINRFIHEGTTYPCTVINLVKTFPGLFGNLRDLAQFKGSGFVTGELPELGWSLITAEAPRESLQKSYMEQNQYLRYVATNFGIPSHMVRRRTLVETMYDIIVGRLALGKTLHKHTLDWTATGSSKNDFICLYVADEGIRIRSMGRTTRHQSLGVSPNW